MKAVVVLLVAAVAALAVVNMVRADLPIHCLNNQVAGAWKFEKSADTFDKTETCGYHAPDVNALHFKNKPFNFEVKSSLLVTLVQPNVVHDEEGKTIGHWTMIYDEGFEVNIDGWTYFAFNKYYPKRHTSLNSEDVNDYVSVCDKTMVGWFHDRDMKKFGCWRGRQVATLKFRETEASVERDEEEDMPSHNTQALKDSGALHAETAPRTSSQGRKLIPFNPNHVVSPFAFNPHTDTMHEAHPVGTSGNKNPVPTAFYELVPHTKKSLAMSRSIVSRNHAKSAKEEIFAPNYQFVEMVNRDTTSTWKAGVHRQFLGKRMSEMDKLLSRRTFVKAHHITSTMVDEHGDKKKKGKWGPPGFLSKRDREEYERDYERMPKQLSWINFDSPIRNQGECGACYSLAAMSVYEVRLRIKTRMADKTLMSGQEVLSCSNTNQGCEGGYPFLVGKHAMEHGLVPEACAPYKASDISCDTLKFTRKSCASRRYKAKNYRYVGGYYGACNELKMMKEIMRAGPVIVAFQAPSSLFYYSGGVFTGPSPKREGKYEHRVRYWEQTNHAVVAMGWGEENGQKFWIIKNTWGPQWGESGYFRIQRGTDECGIESMATTFDVVV